MNKIKQFRQKKKLNQAEFAEALGVTQSLISKVEREDVKANFILLKSMRLVFKFNVNKYLEGSE